MSFTFQSQSYHSTQAVVAACAREWLTAGGANDENQVLRSFAANSDEALADEMIADWDLDEPREGGVWAAYDEDAVTRLTEWEADREDVTAAFAALRDDYAAVPSA